MEKNRIQSGCYSFDFPLNLGVEEKWKSYPIFSGSIGTLDDLSCHASALAHGFNPHPPHAHDEEEILIVLRGEIDIILKEQHLQEQVSRRRLQKNQFAYYPAYFAHTLETTSEEPANYLMLKWRGVSSSAKNPIGFGYFDAASLQGVAVLFEGSSRYLKKFQCHTTVLESGAGYPPHEDPYDVVILMLEGEVRTLDQNIKAPSVIFYEAGSPHGMYNPTGTAARYLVFEFWGRRHENILFRALKKFISTFNKR